MKMTHSEKFNFICKVAEFSRDTWSIRDRLAFEYFNENGLIARHRKNNEAVDQIVKATGIPNGCLFTVGGLLCRQADRVRDLAIKKRPPRFCSEAAINILREHCEHQEAWIEEKLHEFYSFDRLR